MFTRQSFIIMITAAILLMVFIYTSYSLHHPSTNDAYVRANRIDIATRVSGPVTEVLVQDNQFINKGDLLFTIDPTSFQIQLDKASATLALTSSGLKSDDASIEAAQAVVAKTQAELELAKKTEARISKLVRQGRIAEVEGDKAKSKVKALDASLAAAKQGLEQAKEKRGMIGKDNAQLRLAKAAYAEAGINLSYTQVHAPASGTLMHFNLRPGAMITAQTPLFSLIETDQWWVDANFKETQLRRIKPGQNAVIKLDMYPGQSFKGRVDSIARGSGAAFALLPPENASGNWVKVTQRIPVKIVFNATPAQHPLRIGASCTVTIDTNHS